MIVFRRFKAPEEAVDFAQKLKQNGIQSQIIDNSPPIDITFSANHTHDEVQLLIKAADRAKAEEVFRLEAEELIKDIPNDHYLFEFDTQELFEVLKNYDEWNELDYALAQKILADRGEDVNSSIISELRQNRDNEINKAEKAGNITLFLGYLLSLFGGVGGIFIGVYLIVTKKTLTTGQKTNYYRKSDRLHGIAISIISTCIIILWTFLEI